MSFTIRALFRSNDHPWCLCDALLDWPGEPVEPAVEEMRAQWPNATLSRRDETAQRVVDTVFSPACEPLRVLLSGTPFQVKVWEALLDIPFGAVASYGSVADRVGHAKASRAVGSAVGANRLAYLIPCHRVIRAIGESGNYRWGPERKRVMLAWEAAQAAVAAGESAPSERGL